MAATIKVGVIGTGSIVEMFLDACYQNNMECVAIYSRKEETGRRLAEIFYVEDVYTDLDEMLKREDLEFVYVASPNSLHYEQTMKCLAAGKNVICEKPFCSTYEEAKEMAEMAKRNKLFLFEAIVMKYFPKLDVLAEKCQEIAPVRMADFNYHQYSSRYNAFKNGETPNVFNPAFSGGALMDLNVYNIHLAMTLFGKPNEVKYMPLMERNIDISGSALLEYDGFQAVLNASKCAHGSHMCQIVGENGYICIPSGANHMIEFEVYKQDEVEIIEAMEQDNRLFYECEAIKNIYLSNDLNKCYELLDYSLDVMEVLYDLRMSSPLRFSVN